jgi:acetylornithine deacetylase/succinyl-diaminopimelate desuccinylase-like protein
VNTVTELLQALIRVPSVHPDGDPGTDRVGEKACAEFVADFLRSIGAVTELKEVLPGRPNVVGRWPTNRRGKPVLIFAPHTDTVSVSGMTIDPFAGELRAGRVWGRGASDTKGTMASMLFALATLRDELADLSHEIVFAGLCSEESGQFGAKAFVAEHGAKLRDRGAFVIAGEPTGLNAVIAHKGALWLTVTTRGRAVHAAAPDRGESAIYKMADVLCATRDRLAPAFAAAAHPLLGPTTISAGTVTGGSRINIVPDVCRAEIDIRFLPGDETILERVTTELRRACADVEVEHVISQPMLTECTHPMIKHLEACGAECTGAPWFSDAAIFAHAGIPAIACGPGSIAQAHTKDEFIAIEDLERGVQFFRAFLRRLRAA